MRSLQNDFASYAPEQGDADAQHEIAVAMVATLTAGIVGGGLQ